MKSRTSFFNGTALRKDIFRFAPVWALYLIGGLLVSVSTMADAFSWNGDGYLARDLAATIGPFGIINLVYALICAELLFGDLFNSKLCNALHALPLRRESWFFTHTLAGIGFSVVPNLIISLSMMPFLGDQWFVSLIWLLGMTLHYLFFFGLAAVSAVCTGNRFAMALVYGIINFVAVIAAWFMQTFYEPLLYGMHVRYEGFWWFCPTVQLFTTTGELVKFQQQDISDGFMDYTKYVYQGLAGDWWYLAVLAGLSVALLGLGVVLYRRRKLESAGDFLVFRPMAPVFSVIFTLSAGAAFQLFSYMFTSDENYIFMMVGILVGYFVCQMLLKRTVKVFHWKTFLKSGIITTVLGLSILLTGLDPLGITRWTPKQTQVTSIVLTESYYYDPGDSPNTLVVSDPAQIEELIEAHRQILTEGDPEDSNYYYEGDYYMETMPLHITYRLKDGREVERRYYYRTDSDAAYTLAKYFGTPEYVLGYQDWEEFLPSICCANVDWGQVIYEREALTTLAEAVKADCEEGNMIQNRESTAYWVQFEFHDGSTLGIQIYHDSENTLKWIEEHGYDVLKCIEEYGYDEQFVYTG